MRKENGFLSRGDSEVELQQKLSSIDEIQAPERAPNNSMKSLKKINPKNIKESWIL